MFRGIYNQYAKFNSYVIIVLDVRYKKYVIMCINEHSLKRSYLLCDIGIAVLNCK